MKLIEAIRLRIKSLLKEKHLTQYELYKRSGVPQSTISTLLSGDIKDIKLSTLYSLCAGLELEFKDFFSDELLTLENIID